MKAAVIRRYGPASEIEIADLPRPEANGKLLVRVRAASLNPLDVKLRSGSLRRVMPLKFPAVLGFDLFGPVPQTDGALTLATAATVGAAAIFWTSNAVHPDFQTLIGSAIFGGPLGFGVGALAWWMARHLVARRTR